MRVLYLVYEQVMEQVSRNIQLHIHVVTVVIDEVAA